MAQSDFALQVVKAPGRLFPLAVPLWYRSVKSHSVRAQKVPDVQVEGRHRETEPPEPISQLLPGGVRTAPV